MAKAAYSALVCVLMGCSVSAGSPDSADADAWTTSAVVVVERNVGEGGSARNEATARFIQARTFADDRAQRLAGVAIDLPALGACMQLSRGTGGKRVTEGATVTLLDVGPVSLASAPLQARQVPDVANLLSGSVYTASSVDLVPGQPVELRVGRDLTVVQAPQDLGAVRIQGQDAKGTVALGSGPYELDWSGSTSGALYVDVLGEGATSALRCAYEDAGHAAMAEGTLPAGRGSIVVHRLTRTSVKLPGADSAEVRFDFARAFSFVRPSDAR